MLDIVGHIAIDETKPERIRYLIACIRSFRFLRDHCRFILNLDKPSPKLFKLVEQALYDCDFDFELSKTFYSNNYGATYCKLLEEGDNNFILNFIEDHFCVMDNAHDMGHIIGEMKENNADILKTSFFQIEQNSSNTLTLLRNTQWAKTFTHHSSNFIEYQKHYGSRYFIGVNFLTTREFAEKFWGRDIKNVRPHAYELSSYDEAWMHRCMIPNIEILAAIDDPHGEPDSHLLARSNTKFETIYNTVKHIIL